MPVFWLSETEITFPHPNLADDDGILAVGGDLSSERLLLAYQYGIFPWFNPGDPILWWSPDPRFILFPNDLKVSKSMRPYFNQKKFEVTANKAFRDVMLCCKQTNRKGQPGGTWITEEMVDAYTKLHHLGFAHSIEVWQGETLVGGLYGLAMGKIFFGESMFTTVSNASKFGFISMVKKLKEHGFELIDCQQATAHLKSLGGKGIPRTRFLSYLEKYTQEESSLKDWNTLFE